MGSPEGLERFRSPAVPLNDDSRRWLDELLGLPTHDQIARAAYSLWEKEGCPQGRAEEHWRKGD
jgi:Protein of unknown function (DUF2934)